MSFHCKTCGRNLTQSGGCRTCDKPPVFYKGDRLQVTESGLHEKESRDFRSDEVMMVIRMGSSSDENFPYVVFEDSCPSCQRSGRSNCGGHWTGGNSPIKYDGNPCFKKV